MVFAQRFKHLRPESSLAHFLSAHDDAAYAGFITRLDRSPLSAKRIAFLKGLVLNLIILAIVGCLTTAITLEDILYSVNPAPLRLTLCITQDLFIFWAILTLIRSTTIPFLLGECQLRLRYGFRSTEIVIRKPPPVVHAPLKELSEDQRLERYWHIATRAVDSRLLYSNPSAILSTEYWTLEYAVILHAYRSVEKREFEEDELEFAIWKQEHGTWSVCELWRMHEIMGDQQEVAMFKAFLTREGKAELLMIWEDMLVVSEKYNQERRPPTEQKTYRAVVDRFARDGLDYEGIWSRIAESR